MKSAKKTSGQDILRDSRGQIVLEYVFLLIIGVAVAMIITSEMVSRNPESPGFLVQKWSDIITAVGADYADDVKPPE